MTEGLTFYQPLSKIYYEFKHLANLATNFVQLLVLFYMLREKHLSTIFLT